MSLTSCRLFTYFLTIGLSMELYSSLGCSMRYANVYVKTQLKSNQNSVAMKTYDGGTGLFLLDTPGTMYLKSSHPKRDSHLSLLIRSGSDGCPTYWRSVQIRNWAKDPADAADARNSNQVLVIVADADTNCK